ncbi:MAG: uracil-DNA glycosylase [Polyangiales bacterium]
MSADPRAELAELSRLLQTHLSWQRDLGATELPRGVAPPAPPPTPVDPPPPAPVVSAALDPAPPAPPTVSPAPAEPPRAPAPVTAEPPRALTRLEALGVIQAEVQGCTACKLAARRTHTVFARGNPEARLVFVGEAPGEQEDKQGLPFVGPAGALLDKIIVAMSLRPDDVYVCNVVKCRPPGNRQPEADELEACTPFLLRQLGVVRPEIIVSLGRTASSYLLGVNAPMSKIRGRWHEFQGVALMPTWHPSYLLREPQRKADTWADMKLVMRRLGLEPPGRA